MNPYEAKERKHQVHTIEDKLKIEALMQASYLDSTFYNIFNKGSTNNGGQGATATNQNKKLRFSVNNFSVSKILDEP